MSDSDHDAAESNRTPPAIRDAAAAVAGERFQRRCDAWLRFCFGDAVTDHRGERNERYAEESTELLQAAGMTRERLHEIVDWVFDRPAGDIPDEVGGVMNTLAPLCTAHGVDLAVAADVTLEKCWRNSDRIREKHRRKPNAFVG